MTLREIPAAFWQTETARGLLLTRRADEDRQARRGRYLASDVALAQQAGAGR